MRRLVETLEEETSSDWVIRRGATTRPGREVALVGLGRELCGLRMLELATHIDASETKTGKLYRLHRRELEEEGEYAEEVGRLAMIALRRMTSPNPRQRGRELAAGEPRRTPGGAEMNLVRYRLRP
jgi:hypothetical protein